MRYAFILLVAAAAATAQSLPDPRELVRQAFAQDENIFNNAQDYTYTEVSTTRNFDGKGRMTSTESETHEVLYFYGKQYEKLVAKNGKRLSEADLKKQDEKAEKEIRKRERASKRAGDDDDDDFARRRRAAKEVADAFDFKLAGTEKDGTFTYWLIDATPHKGYQAKTREAKLYAKTSGRLWINQADKSLGKAKIRVDDTISFGYFLFRLKPGARIEFERTRVAENTWLPRHFFVKGEAKLGMLKTYRMEVENEYSDYKKFSTDAKSSVGQ